MFLAYWPSKTNSRVGQINFRKSRKWDILPKAIYDFPLYSILFNAQDGVGEGNGNRRQGVNIPIMWDKIFDLNRFIHLDNELFCWILMYIELRNRYFSSKPCPHEDSNDPNWYLKKKSTLFLTINGNPHLKIVLKKLNYISFRDKIINEQNLQPYDFRKHYGTFLNYHEDPQVRRAANNAMGHGGRSKDSNSTFNSFYNLNQV